MIDISSFFTDIFPIVIIIIFLPILLFLLALLFVAWLSEGEPSLPPRGVRGEEGMTEVKQIEVEEEAQLYQELEELQFEVPTPGKVAKAKITKIVRGKLGVLIPIERIRNEAIKERLMQRADRDAIQIEVEHQGIRSRMTMIVSSAPNSTFYRLMKKYKGRLKVGDEIDIIFNDRGFPRPYLD